MAKKHQSRITSSTCIASAFTTPPEILASIFVASMDSDNDSLRQVIACSHVCQFWRSVALTTPVLWTRIDLQHPASEEFATRSRPSPIQIIVDDTGGYRASSIDESILRAAWLTTNISRVQGIHVHASSITVHKIVSLFGSIAPNVLKVDIRFMPLPGDFAFPSVVDFAPNVRRLALWMVDTDLNFYGNLTHISFHSLCPSQLHILPLATVILLLQRSPRLQSLHLFYMHLDNEQGTGAVTVVELAFMEHMVLVDVVGAVDLLSRIFIPASAPILGHRPAEMRRLSDDDRKVCEIRSTGRMLYVNVYELDDVYRRHRSFTLVDDNLVSNGIQSIVLALASCLELSQAQIGALTLDTLADDSGALSTPPSVDSWQEILFALPKMQLILFHHDSAGWTPNVLLALSPSASKPHNQLPCLTMRSLQLCPYSNTSDLHPDLPTSPLSLARTTVQALSARADLGASPLWTLKLDFGDDETTTKLKCLVYTIDFWESMDV